ncbi:MAG: histidine phosphatase family protein [Syntrophorhabdales bacterium]|jgi:alpha-ribazole phosphatase
MTRLFLIRHGETVDEDTKKVYKGKIDIPLSETGIARMRRAAAFLAAFRLDRVYTSSLSRAMDTGRIIAEAQGLDIEALAAFEEIGFGDWEGLSFSEIRERYPEEMTAWLADPVHYVPPGGESFQSVQKRGMDALWGIVDGHKGQNIAVVAHAGILRIMIFALLDITLTNIFRIAQGYGGISIMNIHRDGLIVTDLLNFTYY